MNTLFSPFILYKPYLLIMYDLRQSIQLNKHIINSCLETNIQTLKEKNQEMIDNQFFQHIIEYKL